MSLFNNPFVKICTSGLGTGTDAGKAVGYTVLIFSFVFIAAFYVCKWVYTLFTKHKAAGRETSKI